jgi:flagellar export protein FliJ
MSESRQQRLKRLVDLRAKEVERRVKELGVARTRENKVEQELAETRARRQHELAARDARAREGLPAGDWGHAEIWLTGLGHKEQIAQRQREVAAREVVGARGRVQAAMVEREKIELLMDRVATEARNAETRVERKNEDEHASVQGVHRANGKRSP